MECDAKKKVLIKDFDGGFLGESGSVISQVLDKPWRFQIFFLVKKICLKALLMFSQVFFKGKR